MIQNYVLCHFSEARYSKMGKGEGHGKGQGEGGGDGSGDGDAQMIIGGCCAICVTVCFLVLGIPMMIAGGILIHMFHGNWDL